MDARPGGAVVGFIDEQTKKCDAGVGAGGFCVDTRAVAYELITFASHLTGSCLSLTR